MWLPRRGSRVRDPRKTPGPASLPRSLVFRSGRTGTPENRVSARNGYVSCVGGAPYGSKWKCFWGFVERRALDVWFEFGVDRTFCLWFLAFFVKRTPPAKFGRLLRTNGTEYRNIAWKPLWHRSRDHVWRFSWDSEEICWKSSEKWFLKKIQNGGKSSYTQMGVAYLGRCGTTQGIQGKKNFDFPTYGSRVIGQNVKCAVIAPPWGRLKNV